YDVVALELTLATPVRERAAGEGFEYDASDGAAGRVAFYASAAPLPGFAPVYRWQRGDEVAYGVDAPGAGFARGDGAFYAPAAATVPGSELTYRPVYGWTKGAAHRLSPDGRLADEGYERGPVALYAP
ncbi:MAG TPA: hypothetical protein VFX28_12575, partial [Methylomirabilota bacterium]|nr:hypothetical protein [Methylomirabilota bacterium]